MSQGTLTINSQPPPVTLLDPDVFFKDDEHYKRSKQERAAQESEKYWDEQKSAVIRSAEHHGVIKSSIYNKTNFRLDGQSLQTFKLRFGVGPGALEYENGALGFRAGVSRLALCFDWSKGFFLRKRAGTIAINEGLPRLSKVVAKGFGSLGVEVPKNWGSVVTSQVQDLYAVTSNFGKHWQWTLSHEEFSRFLKMSAQEAIDFLVEKKIPVDKAAHFVREIRAISSPFLARSMAEFVGLVGLGYYLDQKLGPQESLQKTILMGAIPITIWQSLLSLITLTGENALPALVMGKNILSSALFGATGAVCIWGTGQVYDAVIHEAGWSPSPLFRPAVQVVGGWMLSAGLQALLVPAAQGLAALGGPAVLAVGATLVVGGWALGHYGYV